MAFNSFKTIHWENREPNVRAVVTTPKKVNRKFFIGRKNSRLIKAEACLVCQIVSVIKKDCHVKLDTDTLTPTNGTSDSSIHLVDTPCLNKNGSLSRNSDTKEACGKSLTDVSDIGSSVETDTGGRLKDLSDKGQDRGAVCNMTTVPEIMKASCMAVKHLDAFRQAFKEILEHAQEKWFGEFPKGTPAYIKPMMYLRKYRTEPEAHDHLAEPEAHNQLAEPEAHDQLAEPEAHGNLAEPEARGQLAEPEAHNHLAEPEAHDHLAEPESHNHLAEPEAHDQLAEPEAHGNLAEPEAHGQLAEPEAHDNLADPESQNHKEVYQLGIYSSVPARRTALVISLYREDDLRLLMKQSYAFFVDTVAKTLTAFVHKDFDLDSSLQSPCSAWVENIFNEVVYWMKFTKRDKKRLQKDDCKSTKKQKLSM